MENPFDILFHALEHSVFDTVYLIPFLLVTYVVMEWLEHRTAARTQDAVRRAGAAGPFMGALLGAVPQCGFSAAAATLYAGRVITLGTLFAVFLSTSDEMLPLFLAEQVSLQTIAQIMGAKIIVGMVMGFVVDAIIRLARRDNQKLCIHELCQRDKCGCEDCPCICADCSNNSEQMFDNSNILITSKNLDSHHRRQHESCCSSTHSHTDHVHTPGWRGILKSSVIHTLQVTLFVFVITFAFDCVLETVGEDALAAILGGDSLLSVVLAALVGLIPNCAASILIAQMYIEGVLGAGAMLGGLLSSAGIGLLVLFRTNRPQRENILIVALLFAMAVVWGSAVALLGITF